VKAAVGGDVATVRVEGIERLSATPAEELKALIRDDAPRSGARLTTLVIERGQSLTTTPSTPLCNHAAVGPERTAVRIDDAPVGTMRSGGVSSLRQFARPGGSARQSSGGDLCGADIQTAHGHVVNIRERALMCVCRPCYLLFHCTTAPEAEGSVPCPIDMSR